MEPPYTQVFVSGKLAAKLGDYASFHSTGVVTDVPAGTGSSLRHERGFINSQEGACLLITHIFYHLLILWRIWFLMGVINPRRLES